MLAPPRTTLTSQLPADPAFWPLEQWRALQAQRLTAHLQQAVKSGLYATSPCHLAALSPCHASHLDETLRQLPITTKDQLAAAGASAFAAPAAEFREWVCTSGTLGKPLDIPLTQSDLDRLAENEAAALSLAGLSQGDLFILAVAMDRMFVAGLAYWLGAQKIGATCLRAGPLINADLLNRIPGNRTFLIAVPSFLVDAPIGDVAPTAIIAIGEPIRNGDLSYNALGARLQTRFNCPILSTYANTETCTSFSESPLCQGGHLNPQLALVEILDENNDPVAPGAAGEVTITPLGQQAIPLLRFKTGDIAALHTDSCPCGRTTPRLGPILGRRQQLLKIRGTNLYPNTLLDSLRAFPQITDSLLIAHRDSLGSDQLALHLHLASDTPALRLQIETHLRALLRVLPEMHYTDFATIRSLKSNPITRKPTAFVDRR